jgi:hypothetical protein
METVWQWAGLETELFTKYYQSQIKESEMYGVCSTHVGDEKWVHIFLSEILKGFPY